MYVPTPASSRSRLVSGDVQRPCCTRWKVLRYAPISGAPVAEHAGVGDAPAQMIPSGSEWRQASESWSNAAPSQGFCSSHDTLILFLSLSWEVRRRAKMSNDAA